MYFFWGLEEVVETWTVLSEKSKATIKPKKDLSFTYMQNLTLLSKQLKKITFLQSIHIFKIGKTAINLNQWNSNQGSQELKKPPSHSETITKSGIQDFKISKQNITNSSLKVSKIMKQKQTASRWQIWPNTLHY